MKNIVSITLTLFMSLSIIGCNSQNKSQKNTIKEAFIMACLSYDEDADIKDKEYCDCAYSEVAKKYSTDDIFGIYARKDPDELADFNIDVDAANKKCATD